MSTLVARNLAFGYGDRLVGRDIDVSLGASDVVCLLGPNGCGKTTLFKTLLGLMPQWAGTVRVDGHDLRSMSRSEIARRVAYVPQKHHDVFPYSVHDIVLMGRTVHRGLFAAPGPGDHHLVEQILEELGLSELSGSDYTRISGGQQQMVMIARALVQEASLIIMDEPTAGLDFGNQLLILQQVKRLAAAGLGIILSTHNPDHAFDCANRVLVMHEGGIRIDGPPSEVLTPEVLSDLYGVSIAVEAVKGGYVVRPRGAG